MSRADDTDPSRSRGQFEKLVRGTPNANMTPFLAHDDIIHGIKEVADTVRERGVTGTLQLVGGAAIVLTVNASRRLTRDIDAAFAPKDEIEHAADRRRTQALAVLTRIVVDVGETSVVELELSRFPRVHGGLSCLTVMPG